MTKKKDPSTTNHFIGFDGFTNNKLKNVHLDFKEKYLEMTVTLNVSQEMAKFFDSKDLNRKSSSTPYSISSKCVIYYEQLWSSGNGFELLNHNYGQLLKNNMIRARIAKIEMLENQLKNLNNFKIFGDEKSAE